MSSNHLARWRDVWLSFPTTDLLRAAFLPLRRISKGTERDVDLDGWKLLDRAGNKFDLSGKVAAGKGITVALPPNTMPLNNDGDIILLLNADGVPVCRVTYSDSQARAGEWIEFGGRRTK